MTTEERVGGSYQGSSTQIASQCHGVAGLEDCGNSRPQRHGRRQIGQPDRDAKIFRHEALLASAAGRLNIPGSG